MAGRERIVGQIGVRVDELPGSAPGDPEGARAQPAARVLIYFGVGGTLAPIGSVTVPILHSREPLYALLGALVPGYDRSLPPGAMQTREVEIGVLAVPPEGP